MSAPPTPSTVFRVEAISILRAAGTAALELHDVRSGLGLGGYFADKRPKLHKHWIPKAEFSGGFCLAWPEVPIGPRIIRRFGIHRHYPQKARNHRWPGSETAVTRKDSS